MTAKRGNRGKTIRIMGVIVAAIVTALAIFTIISHAVYHRSDMATAVELYFRVSGTKHKFADADACADYIAKRGEAKEYALNAASMKSNVDETAVNGCRVYTLSASGAPEYRVLYLHGGAYINDASAYHWKLCDRLAQDLNAEVVFPIYPLTPNHIWSETYDLITAVYEDILADAEIPVVLMGDSAGGGLAVAFCEYIDEIGLPQPDKLILLSPWMDISMSNPEAANYERADPMLSAYGLIEMGKCWAGELPLDDYRVSPIFGDVSMLQNVTLFVGTREIFYPDVTAFYEMLQGTGVEAALHIGEGMNHVYPLYPIPEADEAFEQIAAALCK